MVCYRQREIFGHTYFRKMMGIMWLSMQNGTWRWWEESLFLHWEGRQALIWILWCSSKMGHRLIAQTELLNTSQRIDSFHAELIAPGHPIPQITTHLTIFCGGTWKTKFIKTIHRQQRFSKTTSEEKSRRFHKKCSIELWTILMFELLLSYSSAVHELNISLITEKMQ